MPLLYIMPTTSRVALRCPGSLTNFKTDQIWTRTANVRDAYVQNHLLYNGSLFCCLLEAYTLLFPNHPLIIYHPHFLTKNSRSMASANIYNHSFYLQVLKDGLSALHVPYAYGFAIILLTVLVKAATFPLTKKQVKCAFLFYF